MSTRAHAVLFDALNVRLLADAEIDKERGPSRPWSFAKFSKGFRMFRFSSLDEADGNVFVVVEIGRGDKEASPCKNNGAGVFHFVKGDVE
jgi:hypothetical protein